MSRIVNLKREPGAVASGAVLRSAAAWAAAQLGGKVDGANAAVSSAIVPSGIKIERIGADEWRIREDDRCVGGVYRHEDILHPGTFFFVIHLDEDWRGPQRVHDPRRVRGEVHRLVASHPVW